MNEQRFSLRCALAGIVAIDLASFFFFIGDARRIAFDTGMSVDAWTRLVSDVPLRALLSLAGIASAFAFARRPGRIGAGAVALVALAVSSTVQAQLFGSPWRHLYYSGLALTGWLAGLAFARVRGSVDDESYARTGSLALIAAAYLNAGISKLVFGGAGWVTGITIQAVVLGQAGLGMGGLADAYRGWVVNTRALPMVFSVGTLFFELGAPMLLAGRRPRQLFAGGLLAMHLNIFVLTGILYWQAMVLLVLFGMSSDATMPQPETRTVSRSRVSFLAAVAVLVTCAAIGITHQGRRAVLLVNEGAGASYGGTFEGHGRHQIGPFEVGEVLADGWILVALTAGTDTFSVVVSGHEGRVVFDLSCSPSPKRSPFDIGDAHVFYRSDLDFERIRAVGEAVRDHAIARGSGEKPCDAWQRWLREARS